MKIFRMIDNRMKSAELPDGVLMVGHGSVMGLDGKNYEPMTSIDYQRKLYWRANETGPGTPFPERWIGEDGLKTLEWTDAEPEDAR
jgi:hypothetical protein